MGILSNLFKSKSAQNKTERAKPRFLSSASPSLSPDPDEAPPPPSAPAVEEEKKGDAPVRAISFGGSRQKAEAPPAPEQKEEQPPALDAALKQRQTVPVKATPVVEQDVALEISDVLPHIPAEFLKPDAKNGKDKIVLKSTDLFPTLSHGKASMPLTRIAALASELFATQELPADAQVPLPLKKIVAQIGGFPTRPDQIEEVYPSSAQFDALIREKANAVPVPVEKSFQQSEIAAPPAPVERPIESAPAPAPAADIKKDELAAVEAPDPFAGETVTYSLAAMLTDVPAAWFVNELKSVDDSVRITVPFQIVEAQLASGVVELTFEQFIAALPGEFKGRFTAGTDEARNAKLTVPLNEVFQNLPGADASVAGETPAGLFPTEGEKSIEQPH